MNETVIIQCSQLSKVYRMGDTEVYALRDMDLEVLKGEYLSAWGPAARARARC